MANVGMTLHYNTELDLTPVRKGIAEVGKIVKENPFSLNIEKTGGGPFGPQFKDVETFFHEVSAGTNNIKTLSVSMTEFRDKAGNVFSVPTHALEVLNGATNSTKDTTIKLNQAYIETKKATDGWLATGKVTKTTLDLGAAAKKTEADMNALAKTLDNDVKAADRFLSKSANMSGKQVEDAKKVALALKAEKAEFDKLFGASNKDWDAIGKKGEQVKELARQLDNAKSATNAGANAFQSWSERIGNAIKQTISYGLSIKLVQEAQKLFNDAVKYAIELNKEMTNIQVLQTEGAKTPEEINALADSFNKLGQEMGASTIEIAKGSVEWLRQGRTIAETGQLLRSSLMLAKLGAMNSADATNYLTSITNAFKISTEDAVTVVDKLIAVDNISATSAGELATALRYTSESAAIAGVSFEQLVSYIGTVSTVTRQNAEMIGQAFKTMFARMTQIQGGGVDETGQTISKVEKALAAVNIQIKDANGEWLGMGDVLEQTAAKWDTLSTREQTEIAVAVAGVRQKEAFLVLMDNMNNALTYQVAQTDAAGLAQDRYGIYLESVEAKQGKLTAQMQQLYTTVVNGKLVAAFYDIGIGILSAVNNSHILIPALITILGLLIAIKRQDIGDSLTLSFTKVKNVIIEVQKSLAVAKTMSTIAGGGFQGLKAGLSSLTGGIQAFIGGISATTAVMSGFVIVIAAVAGAIYLHNKQVEDATKVVNDFIEAQSKIPQNIINVRAIGEEISDLNTKKAAGYAPGEEGTAEAAQDAEALANAYERLYKILPNLDWHWSQGRPFLVQALDARQLAEEAKNGTEATADQVHALKIYTEENFRNYAIAKSNYEQELKTQEVLEGTWNAYRTGGFTAVRMYHKSITDTYKDMPLAAKLGVDAANKVIGNDIYLGVETTDWKNRMSKAMTDVNSQMADDSKVVDSYESMFKKLISLGINAANGDMKTWLKTILKVYPELEDLTKQIQNDTKANISFFRDSMAENSNWVAEQAKKSANEERANQLYTQQIDLIKTIYNGLRKIKDIDASTLEGRAKITEEMQNFSDEINNLGIEGLSLELEEFYNSETKTWDITGLEKWAKSITLNKDLMKELRSLSVELADSIEAYASNSGAAFDQNTEKLYQFKNVYDDTVSMTQKQLSDFSSLTSDALWQLVVNTTGAITDINGVQITTSENFRIAMSNGLINFSTFLADLGIKDKALIDEIIRYWDSAVAHIQQPIKNPYIPIAPWTGGGGGGGAPPNPRIKEIEDEVKALNKRKDALQDQLKAFKDYIDLQKESLKRSKEEADFQDELTKKHKELGNIKARLAVLALDNSEEAQKEREKLEEDAGSKEEDITKLTEDRKYNLQIQALDDLQKAFEDNINAQIKGIDDSIDKLNEEKDALQAVADKMGGGGGVGDRSVAGGYKIMKKSSGEYKDKAKADIGETDKAVKDHTTSITKAKDKINEAGGSWNTIRDNTIAATTRAEYYLEVLENITKEMDKQTNPVHQPGHDYGNIHQGGIVESHHNGQFAGNLMTNEVFSKLLKGEYVATEGQMNNFLKNVLPKIATSMSPALKQISYNNQTGGDVYLDMPITVMGNLDKTVVPSIQESVLKIINKSLGTRGIRRTAGNFTI